MFRGLAARLNYMSLDDSDLQFGVKVCSRDMANPKKGSWRMMKKVARYLVGREAVVKRDSETSGAKDTRPVAARMRMISTSAVRVATVASRDR